MKRGLIVGEIWATRKVSALAGKTLKLIVEHPQAATASESQLDAAPLCVAIDTLDARSGEEVLVAYGSGARNVLVPGPHNRHVLCDAAVALIVDGPAPTPAQKNDQKNDQKGT
jgi:microcompartment protein CcmK/EutM